MILIVDDNYLFRKKIQMQLDDLHRYGGYNNLIVTAESIPSAKEIIKHEGKNIKIIFMDWLYPVELVCPEEFVDELRKKGYNIAIVTAVPEKDYIQGQVGEQVPIFSKPDLPGLVAWAKNTLEAR